MTFSLEDEVKKINKKQRNTNIKFIVPMVSLVLIATACMIILIFSLTMQWEIQIPIFVAVPILIASVIVTAFIYESYDLNHYRYIKYNDYSFLESEKELFNIWYCEEKTAYSSVSPYEFRIIIKNYVENKILSIVEFNYTGFIRGTRKKTYLDAEKQKHETKYFITVKTNIEFSKGSIKNATVYRTFLVSRDVYHDFLRTDFFDGSIIKLEEIVSIEYETSSFCGQYARVIRK